MSIAYFMSIAPVKHLVIQSFPYGFGDQGAKTLARCKHQMCFLKKLDLDSNKITHKETKSLATIIKSNTNLTYFSVANNPISDDGIKLLEFKHLIRLNIEGIRMTERGVFALGENLSLKLNNSLQSLNIGQTTLKTVD